MNERYTLIPGHGEPLGEGILPRDSDPDQAATRAGQNTSTHHRHPAETEQ